jgi:hypothetical protein
MNYAANVEWMRLRNGNLGIGTNGPAQKLEVTGNVLIGRYSGTAFSRFVGIGAASGDMITGSSGGSYVEFANSGSPNDDSIHFITHKGGVSHTRRMTIDPLGNVGIGTTSPTNPLVVDANNSGTSPIVAYSAQSNDVFSVLPHPNITYLASGLYYKNGSWVHDGYGTTNALLGFGGGGANWHASNNSTASWNLASGVPLWTA